MQLKLDENGTPILEDGKPVYVDDDGKTYALDAADLYKTVRRLNFEAQTHREEKQALSQQLKAYDGIDNPDDARKALKTVAGLNDKQLVDAGEMEGLKNRLMEAAKAKENELTSQIQGLQASLNEQVIGGSFSQSKFIADKCAVPVDMLRATFGNRFKVEDGGLVAYDEHGQKIYSRDNPSVLASFDEAISVIVDGYQYKDSILKPKQGSGTSAPTSKSQSSAPRNVSGNTKEDAKTYAERFGLPEH